MHNDNDCGIDNSQHNVAQRRIVGGDEAGFGSFPWQAYIRIGQSYLSYPKFVVPRGLSIGQSHLIHGLLIHLAYSQSLAVVIFIFTLVIRTLKQEINYQVV